MYSNWDIGTMFVEKEVYENKRFPKLYFWRTFRRWIRGKFSKVPFLRGDYLKSPGDDGVRVIEHINDKTGAITCKYLPPEGKNWSWSCTWRAKNLNPLKETKLWVEE